MKLRYSKINPSGNITLLVTDPVPRQDQSEIARRLMALDPDAEQVGFLENAALPGARMRLQMMGGEFCGNATMSAACYLARECGMADGEAVFPLEVSGARGIIPCTIRKSGEGCTGTVPMPLPEEITQIELLPSLRVPLVRFDGISHLIVPEDKFTADQAREMIPALCERLNADALGILLTPADLQSMRPLVYVRSTDSAVWENSCGSGTAAIGACLAFQRGGGVCIPVSQPCPDTCITVSAQCEGGRVTHLEITGNVRIDGDFAPVL